MIKRYVSPYSFQIVHVKSDDRDLIFKPGDSCVHSGRGGYGVVLAVSEDQEDITVMWSVTPSNAISFDDAFAPVTEAFEEFGDALRDFK